MIKVDVIGDDERFEVPYEIIDFPAGEISVRINVEEFYKHWGFSVSYTHWHTEYIADIENHRDLMVLLHIRDAMRYFVRDVNFQTNILYMNYLPYGRDDRVMVRGASFGLKVFANIINSMNFDKVYTNDPHSEVSSELINNLKIKDNRVEMILKIASIKCGNKFTIVAPDKGAIARASSVATTYNNSILSQCVMFVNFNKTRDVNTGKIVSIDVVNPELVNVTHDAFIIDDICDGGGTFIPIAQKLKEMGFKRVILLVSHGIFSKGKEILYQGGIDQIVSLNSVNSQT